MESQPKAPFLAQIDKKLLPGFKEIRRGTVTFLNPYSYLVARKNPQYLDSIDYIAIDGSLLAKFLTLTLRKVDRLSFDFTSMANQIFSSLENSGGSVYFVGSTNSNIKKFIQKVAHMYPDLSIVGYRDGYFSNQNEMALCIDDIIHNKADVVIAGMGTGLQEQFLSLLKTEGWPGAGYTCGGFIHQIANTSNAQYYPDWINNYGLRWAYRIYDEPKLIKRYLVDYGTFLPVFIWDAIYYKFKSR